MNVVAAVAAARELPQLSLEDALELTLLVARKDPRRHPRVAARWLKRYLEKIPWRRSRRQGSPRRRSSPSPAPDTRRPCRRCGPWPKEPLGDEESKA